MSWRPRSDLRVRRTGVPRRRRQDGVTGTVGHNQGADDHERRIRQRHGNRSIEDKAAVGDPEDDPKDHADDKDRQHRPGDPGPAPAHGVASPPLLSWNHAPPGPVTVHGDRPEIVTNRLTVGTRRFASCSFGQSWKWCRGPLSSSCSSHASRPAATRGEGPRAQCQNRAWGFAARRPASHVTANRPHQSRLGSALLCAAGWWVPSGVLKWSANLSYAMIRPCWMEPPAGQVLAQCRNKAVPNR